MKNRNVNNTKKRMRKNRIKELLETIESFYDELHSEEFYGTVMAGLIVMLSLMILAVVCLAVGW